MSTGYDPVAPGSHPDVLQLAEYADDVLPLTERSQVATHLVTCARCRSIVVNAALFRGREAAVPPREVAPTPATVMAFERPEAPSSPAQVSEQPPITPRHRWVRTVARVAAALLLVGIAIAAVVEVRDRRQLTRGIEALTAAASAERQRPLDGRLFGVPHRAAPDINRGRDTGETATNVLKAAAELQKVAEERDGAAGAAAMGFAFAMMDRIDTAVAEYAKAVDREPSNASYRSDLSAVYLARFVTEGVPADLTSARAAAERALEMDPTLSEACFNRAFALELMDSPDALQAWQQCLETERDPQWRAEIGEHVKRLSASETTPPGP